MIGRKGFFILLIVRLPFLALFFLLVLSPHSHAKAPVVPVVASDWWTMAGNPDLGELGTDNQEPVDFAIWQAGDRSWQVWSCIRRTREEGRTRLFHRWEGKKLKGTRWSARGIAMRARPELGETPGGLQAPFVVREGPLYHMFYGDMENICVATSEDGKLFTRELQAHGRPSLFDEGDGANARDAMLLKIGDRWHCYYTAHPGNKGAVYCRTSPDLRDWSDSVRVAAGGEAGTGPFSAECPFVVEPVPGHFFLFRTQAYGEQAITRVYHSTNPMNFGIDQDERYLVADLPVAAPEILFHEGKYYIASLLPSLTGIRLARLEWVKPE